MPKPIAESRTLRQAVLTARISAAALGAAMLTWGLAPAIIGLAIRPEPWQLQKLLASGVTLLIGLTFITLGAIATARRAWPLWAALALGLTLLAVHGGLYVFGGTMPLSVFPLVLTACTVGATCLALDAQRKQRANTTPASVQ